MYIHIYISKLANALLTPSFSLSYNLGMLIMTIYVLDSNLISVLVLTSHIKCNSILLLFLLCLAEPFYSHKLLLLSIKFYKIIFLVLHNSYPLPDIKPCGHLSSHSSCYYVIGLVFSHKLFCLAYSIIRILEIKYV